MVFPSDFNLVIKFTKSVLDFSTLFLKFLLVCSQLSIKASFSFFNKEITDQIKSKNGRAQLLTSTNVFAHMSTLGDVMDGITNLIDDDGYYAFENHYIMEILDKLQYDTFYHEHLRTYSILSLIKLFEMYNLCLFDAQIVSRYGGSIRCIVSKKKERKQKD